MINWQYFPKSEKIPTKVKNVVNVFENESQNIDSKHNNLGSNEVLEILRTGFENIGYKVEKNKTAAGKIKVPVLFGKNGSLIKSFDADAYNEDERIIIEVEAGRGVTNYQFLKDLFQAFVMHDVDYLVIAIRNDYRGNNDFEKVVDFIDAMYSSTKFKPPLTGILIVGY